jgi:cyclic-di-AMP phosphodiesterase PgpH
MADPFFHRSKKKKCKDKWHALLSETHFGKRLLIGFIFLIALTAFLHFREVRIQMPDLNSTAEQYVIAQVDFDFPDEEATKTLKQEAVLDIGQIYKLDDKQLEKRRQEFENSVVKNQNWRQELQHATFEEIYNESEKLVDILLQCRFTDSRTFQKMKSLQFPIENIFVFTSSQQNSPISLPEGFWDMIKKDLKESGKFHSESIDYILKYFSDKSWNLHEDGSKERALRQQVESRVPMKHTKIDAGTVLIFPGEIVTARHIAMLKAMKNALSEERNLWAPMTMLGSFLLALIITGLCAIYLRISQREVLNALSKLTLLVTIAILTMFLSKLTEYFLINKTSNLIDVVRYPIFVPFAAIIICVLIGPPAALFTSGLLAVVIGISLAVNHDRFLVINLIAALVAILCARSMHKRKEVFRVCAKVWLSCVPVIIAFNLISNDFWYLNLMTDLVSTLIFLAFTAIVVVGLLPILESIFHVMTDMSLMEYMDPNNDLLRRLSLEAPGTYQHSLVVGNLAESAARAIGANGLFCRVSTLYHDIGKLFNPHYFTENQLGGFNIHQLLTPLESTQVIIAHVAEGEQLARKHRLPQNFIDIIREHHGTTLVYYFYCKQVEQMGGDASLVDEKKFRYPGPKPHSKESAIIMIADIIEAASRSMEEMSEQNISEMVDKLVSAKADDGQFEECKLTFEELGTVKKTIIKALLVAGHFRVKYPTKK